jgi:hypothetical protein
MVLLLPPARAQNKDLKREYRLGRIIGECLVARCQVVTGWLIVQSLVHEPVVKIRVDKVEYGPEVAGGSLEVPYFDPESSKKQDQNLAWQGVKLEDSAPVTVVVTLIQLDGGTRAEPVIVSSTPAEISLIRTLVMRHARLDSFPFEVSAAVDELSGKPNGALGGYLGARLGRREAVFNPDLGSLLLARLVGSKSVPEGAWDLLAGFAVVNYHSSTVSGRGAVARRFAELTQENHPAMARAGLNGLARIASFDRSWTAAILPATLDKIVDTYRTMMNQSKMMRSVPLESALGIK